VLLQIIERLLLGPNPRKFRLTITPVYLAEGPCNMGETQHKLAVEISKSQEAPKLSECCWGWPVTDDLDLGWIHMYAMLINDVAQVMDPVHVEGSFFHVDV
jgi:hypothetical protein